MEVREDADVQDRETIGHFQKFDMGAADAWAGEQGVMPAHIRRVIWQAGCREGVEAWAFGEMGHDLGAGGVQRGGEVHAGFYAPAGMKKDLFKEMDTDKKG